MSRQRWAKRLTVGASVLLATIAPAATAQDAPAALGGFSLLARASPVQITYDSPGLLPVSPILQVSVPESLASLSTGPSGYGLASLAFPGPLVADIGSALAQAGDCAPPFPVPTYPLRAEAFSPQGPLDVDASPAPGSRMRAHADGVASSAFSALDDLSFPGVVNVGSVTGQSSTSAVGDAVVTKARSVVNDVSILLGAIRIGSIVTDITATSGGDDKTTITEGTTTVSGASIGGQQVIIDENGITLAGNALGGLADLLTGIVPSLNDALAQAGITIRVLNHQENKGEGLAERIAGGLSIEMNYNGRTTPLISQLLAAIPTGQLPSENLTECAPSSPQAVVSLLKEIHVMSIDLAGATASSNAAGAFVSDLIEDFDIPGLPDLSGAGVTDLGGSLGDFGVGTGSPSQSGSGALSTAGASRPFPGGEGVPPVLVLLLFALFPVLGAAVQRLADATLAAPVAAPCPLEGDQDDG